MSSTSSPALKVSRVHAGVEKQPGQAFFAGFVGEDGLFVQVEAVGGDVEVELAVGRHEVHQTFGEGSPERLRERIVLGVHRDDLDDLEKIAQDQPDVFEFPAGCRSDFGS